MTNTVKLRVYPKSKESNVVVTLVEGDIMTPIRLSESEAKEIRRWLLGLFGANHRGPANLEFADNRKFNMPHETWSPMLEVLNQWYETQAKEKS